MQKLILASNNEHKVKEVKRILSDYKIVTLSDIGFNEEIEETGATFEENATLKARTVRQFLVENDMDIIPVIADDSGLCCNGLNGEPGIYSARYSGKDNEENRKLLISNLKNNPDKSAYFNCTISIVYPDCTCDVVNGKTYGNIIDKELGDTSFGYDCIFYSTELNKTFGEASDTEKDSVSHRGRALEELKDILKNKNI